ncbi:MAG: 50S ribosomal protein L22 [Spirochaetales bacterium]|nr:50S ribosomal protein L22 [Spirochaetales bacterium]
METKKGYKAHLRFIRISPSKVRRIANNIRKKPYTEVLSILENLPHKGAKFLRKAIMSAVANALYHNDKLDEDTIYIKELQVNDGPRMKRIWVRGRGRADRLIKRLCHISVVIDEIGEVKGK